MPDATSRPGRWAIMLTREGDPVGFYAATPKNGATGLESQATTFPNRDAAAQFLTRFGANNRFPGHTTYLIDLDDPFSTGG